MAFDGEFRWRTFWREDLPLLLGKAWQITQGSWSTGEEDLVYTER